LPCFPDTVHPYDKQSVSTDSHFVHKAWHDASATIRKIAYPMLADHTGAAF
jgi:alkyl hydroperoxide reductase subunit AhpC